MLKFHKIAIEGFRSFADDQIFVFPSEPCGFYLVTGENKAEPDLGANGSGKSSFFESLCWVLFGKTSRGLRGKDISNRYGDYTTSVCLEFFVDGELYGLTRTWNPITLVLDKAGSKPKIISQEELEDLLGASYVTYLRNVFFGQFQAFFFDESSSKKLEILTEIVELDVWDTASANAKNLIKEIEDNINVEKSRQSRYEGEMEALDIQRLRFVDLSLQFEAEKSEAKTYLEADLAGFKEELQIQKEGLKTAADSLAAITTKEAKRTNALESATASKDRNNLTLGEVRSAIAVLEDRVTQALNKQAKMKSLTGTCPYCEQRINEEHKNKLRLSVEADKMDLKDDLAALRIQEEGIIIKIREYEQTERDLRKELRFYSETRTELETQVSKHKTKSILISEAIERTKKDLENLELRKNLPREELIGIQEKLKVAKEQYQKSVEIHKGLADDKSASEFWADKFREIRLWVVEQAITELELHCNNALEELGLVGYKIKMDIERPKADRSGYIKSFQVFITSKESTEPIPWESWSGGESQRLRLAGTIGLADLITSRKGFVCNTEIWDEPTAHLSQEGIDDLLTVLGSRSKLRNKQIWLVDHRSLNAGDFDGSLHIIKDETGSKIQQPQPRTKVLKKKLEIKA